jgi:protein-L-isoaspartate(D-aspartate) O-methyltransferase
MKDMVDSQIIRRGIVDPMVINAMKTVDRSLFVRESDKIYAYKDSPLIIGHGQTISQPYIVGYMTELLNLKKEHHVLEIGTGSGYQTAILASIAQEVYSVETIDALYLKASAVLKDRGFNNIHLKNDDGYYGWSEKQPFDAIIVTAAAPKIPEPLILQLADPGRLVIPIGPVNETQYLTLIEKVKKTILQYTLIPVRFVPFISVKNFS